jgi:hypothetical protein
MKKIVIGLTLAAVLILIAATVVFAQEETPLFPGGHRPGRMGGGMIDPVDGSGVLHDYMLENLAEALDISPEEFLARHEAGETMYDIAASLGLDWDQFVQVMAEARADAFEQAYADGLLTDEQYEFYQNSGDFGHMGGGHGGHGGHGGFGTGGYDGECPYADSDI